MCHVGMTTTPRAGGGWLNEPGGRPEGAGRESGSSRVEVGSSAPSDRYAGSRAGVVVVVPRADETSTPRKRFESFTVSGLGPRDPTDPGTATAASTIMRSVLATTLGRRTSREP